MKHYNQSGPHKGWYGNRFFESFLLFVYDAETEVDLIAFAVIGVDVENIRKRFLRVVERRISIVQQSNPIPNIRILRLVLSAIAREQRIIHL